MSILVTFWVVPRDIVEWTCALGLLQRFTKEDILASVSNRCPSCAMAEVLHTTGMLCRRFYFGNVLEAFCNCSGKDGHTECVPNIYQNRSSCTPCPTACRVARRRAPSIPLHRVAGRSILVTFWVVPRDIVEWTCALGLLQRLSLIHI